MLPKRGIVMADRLTLVLGPQYAAGLWDLHKHLAQQDRLGEAVVIVRLRAPITSDAVDIAILSGSLYLVGIRGRDGRWFEFANDAGLASSSLLRDAAPRLPGSRWIRVGTGIALSTYRALQLPTMMTFASKKSEQLGYVGSPAGLISHFSHWNGMLNASPERMAVCILILLVCEALRFRSIERVCADWILGRGPDALAMRLVYTATMLETVQDWRKKALGRDPDVTMAPPDLPDPLIV